MEIAQTLSTEQAIVDQKVRHRVETEAERRRKELVTDSLFSCPSNIQAEADALAAELRKKKEEEDQVQRKLAEERRKEAEVGLLCCFPPYSTVDPKAG